MPTKQQKLINEIQIIKTKINDLLATLDELTEKKGQLEDQLLQEKIDNNSPIEVIVLQIVGDMQAETKQVFSDHMQLINFLSRDWDSIESDLGVLTCVSFKQ